jgi:hypothetical protein
MSKKLFAIDDNNLNLKNLDDLFAGLENTQADNFLKNKRKAEDFFNDEDIDIENIQNNENKDLSVVSSFTSDEEGAKKELAIVGKNKRERKNISLKFLRDKYYCGEEITEQLKHLKKRKHKKKFLDEFQLKEIKFKNIDVTFTIDLFRNKDNYYYGSMQIKDIPQYRRLDVNRIVGIKNPRVTREILNELNELIGQYTKLNNTENNKIRYFEAPKLLFQSSDKVKKLSTRFNYNAESIPFNKVAVLPVSKENNLGELNIDYSLLVEERDRYMLEKNKEFNKLLSENPGDVNNWLGFIKFQDEINSNEKAKNEIKLSIIEKALKCLNNNQQLHLIHIRILKRLHFDDFEFLNSSWLNKLKILYKDANFLKEYLNFLKFYPKLTITNIRDNFLFLLKFYESKLKEESENFNISKLQIDILIEYIVLERDSGYYERSFNILRCFIELKTLILKNIIRKNQIENFAKYFESEFPKLGDFKDSIGYLDYIQNKNKLSVDIFYKPDFIENFRPNKNDENFYNTENEAKNYRALNILFDKNVVETQAESFIFYSDLKDFTELEITLNEETMYYLIKQSLTYLGLNSKVLKFYEQSDFNFFIYDEKFVKYGKEINFDPQLFEYFNRIFEYLECMNIAKEKIKQLKIDLRFLNKAFNFDEKVSFAKNLLKNNQENLKLWLSYFQWCLYFRKFEDCEKIIKLLNAKNSKDSKFKAKLFEENLNFYLFRHDKYTFDDFQSLALSYINEYIGENYTEMNKLTLLSILSKLENFDKNLAVKFYLITICLTFSYFSEEQQITKKLASDYINNLKNITNGLNEKVKEKIFLLAVKLFIYYRSRLTPYIYSEILTKIAGIFEFENEIFNVLLIKELCKFNNLIDRDIRFLNFFNKKTSLKVFLYFILFRYRKTKANELLPMYKEYWNLVNKNILNCTQDGSLSYTPNEFIKYWKTLTNKLFEEGEYLKYLEYSLFSIHEFAYNKKAFLEFFKNIDFISQNSEVDFHKFLDDVINVLTIKEIRLYNEININ